MMFSMSEASRCSPVLIFWSSFYKLFFSFRCSREITSCMCFYWRISPLKSIFPSIPYRKSDFLFLFWLLSGWSSWQSFGCTILIVKSKLMRLAMNKSYARNLVSTTPASNKNEPKPPRLARYARMPMWKISVYSTLSSGRTIRWESEESVRGCEYSRSEPTFANLLKVFDPNVNQLYWVIKTASCSINSLVNVRFCSTGVIN